MAIAHGAGWFNKTRANNDHDHDHFDAPRCRWLREEFEFNQFTVVPPYLERERKR